MNALSAATDGVTVYAVSDHSFFTYNSAHNEISTYSKVEGMSDVGMSYVAYDATTGYAILAYANGNIDLFRDEAFFNIPDIKLKNIGSKKINHIFVENGLAYLSTSFGIVVLNLDKRETKETYAFTLNNQSIEVKEVASSGNYLYALTAMGLYRATKNSLFLQVFSTWQLMDSRKSLKGIAASGDRLFVNNADTVFVLSQDTLQAVYEVPKGTKDSIAINQIDSAANGIWINEDLPKVFTGKVRLMNTSFQIVDSFNTRGRPGRTFTLSDQSVWVADVYNGICKRSENNDLIFYKPQGPPTASTFDILAYNGDVWVAHGGYSDGWTYLYNGHGFSHFKGGNWTNYNTWSHWELYESSDFIVFARNPADGSIYAGSYRSGIIVLSPDGAILERIKEGDILEPAMGDPSSYRVSGLAFDPDGNLWTTQSLVLHDLKVKTKEGNWKKLVGPATTSYSAYVLVDDYNQKWYLMPGSGLAVYDDNRTPENPNDDRYMKVSTTDVSSVTVSIAKDKAGAIWVGTNDGIGIINCPDQIWNGGCKVERPIVQFDQFAGYLFQNERVKTIAVDGANRKWIGTTNGVWLVSQDGDAIISRFTAENSPLPSDNIQKISVDPVTGDVYIGTQSGLVSYRGTAVDGGETNQNVTTFPNPVPSGYNGTIAIRGVAENADVRITDISGQLVFRTKALGGQATWNGLDYTGKRPQSGVYLIFVSNRDGSQTHAGKMVFME